MHEGGLPCFVQPKHYALQSEHVQQQQNDDDDDDADDDEEEEESTRKTIRFVFWDVESEQLAANAEPDGYAQMQHRALLVCAEVYCELCIAAGVNVEREPIRRADGCVCGMPVGAQRLRWCMPVDEQVVAAGQMPTDRLNGRRLAFHQFGGDAHSAIAQFVDFLIHHGPRHGVRTIALSHNGVILFCFFFHFIGLIILGAI